MDKVEAGRRKPLHAERRTRTEYEVCAKVCDKVKAGRRKPMGMGVNKTENEDANTRTNRTMH